MSNTPEQKRYNIATELYRKYPNRFEIVPICDKLGFSQHIGECWIDTIQEVFFYTDGLRELTQPLFYHLKDEDIETRVNSHTDIDPSEKDDYIQGLKSMRDRFIQHYDFMVHDVKIKACQDPRAVYSMYNAMSSEEEPSEEEPAGKKPSPLVSSLRTKSAKLGVNIGMRFQSPETKAKRSLEIPYIPGGHREEEENVLNKLFQLFDLPFQINSVSSTPILAMGITSYYIVSNKITRTDDKFLLLKDTEITPKAHATGFFKCNNEWYYYDDNKGLWATSEYIITQIKELTEEGILLGIHTEKSDGKVYLYAMTLFDWENPKDKEKAEVMAQRRGNGSLSGSMTIKMLCTNDGWTASLEHPVLQDLNSSTYSFYGDSYNRITIAYTITRNTEHSTTGGRPPMYLRNKRNVSRRRSYRRKSMKRKSNRSN